MTKKSDRYVALMRGINVGGKNKLPMRDLIGFFEQAGATNVSTYIQSGNVAFSARPSVVKKIADSVTSIIANETGLRLPIVLRSADELATIVERNPFSNGDSEKVQVMFLKDTPTKMAVAGLDANRSPGDVFHVVGNDVYLCCESVAKTKLTNAYFDSKLSTVSTLRNWRTVLKLIQMTQFEEAASPGP